MPDTSRTQPARSGWCRCARVAAEQVAARAHHHHDLLERGVAGARRTVNGVHSTWRAVQHRRQRVGDREGRGRCGNAHGKHGLVEFGDLLAQGLDERRRTGAAGCSQPYRGCSRWLAPAASHGLEHASRGNRCPSGRRPRAKTQRRRCTGARALPPTARSSTCSGVMRNLFLHVDRAGGDEGVDAPAPGRRWPRRHGRCPSPPRAQAAHRAFGHGAATACTASKSPGLATGKPASMMSTRMRSAAWRCAPSRRGSWTRRALLAVAQRGVKNNQFIVHVLALCMLADTILAGSCDYSGRPGCVLCSSPEMQVDVRLAAQRQQRSTEGAGENPKEAQGRIMETSINEPRPISSPAAPRTRRSRLSGLPVCASGGAAGRARTRPVPTGA